MAISEEKKQEILDVQFLTLSGAARLKDVDRKQFEIWWLRGYIKEYDHDEYGQPRFLYGDVSRMVVPERRRGRQRLFPARPPKPPAPKPRRKRRRK